MCLLGFEISLVLTALLIDAYLLGAILKIEHQSPLPPEQMEYTQTCINQEILGFKRTFTNGSLCCLEQ